MSKNDGGPAFPSGGQLAEIVSRVSQNDVGMSLRDYFAAAALQWGVTESSGIYATPSDMIKSTAAIAYAIADAMLAERSKTEGTP